MPNKSEKDAAQSTMVPADDNLYAALSYDEMVTQDSSMDVVQGSNLIEDKTLLEKSPFVIVQMTFRPSDMSDAQYVSVICKSRDHGDVVFNDGSTGVRRQLMNYCIAKKIAVLNGDMVIPDWEGNPGDMPAEWFDWAFPPASVSFDDNGNTVVDVTGIRLHCPRGLRLSTYEQDDPDRPGKKRTAKTFYLG